MSVKFEDNSDKVLDEFGKRVYVALEAIGLTAEKHAAKNTPVDTGRLRASITWGTKKNEGTYYSYKDNNGKEYTDERGSGAEENSVYIGTNVEYAPSIELGSPKTKAKHMLKNAATRHSDEYKRLVEQILDK